MTSAEAAAPPPAAGDAALEVAWLGRVEYGEALAIQRRRVEARRRGAVGDALLLLEHPPVVTLGRRGREENLRVPPEALARRGVAVHRVSRGGDVTWHGPGQLVGYPILDLAARGRADVHAWLREVETLLVEALAALGLPAGRRPGWTGVFVDPARHPGAPPRKIASIGVGLRGWITCHGFALNVTCDLSGFADIVPCGLHGVEMTSLARELPREDPEALWARARETVAATARRRLGPPAARAGARRLAPGASIG